MNIHEYQAKALLREYGAPVSEGYPAFSGGRLWAIKAQIHAGGRGKGGI